MTDLNPVVLVHVVAAILLLGPVTVAVSAFPRQATTALSGDTRAAGTAGYLHSMTKNYGLWSTAVPLLGLGALFTDLEYLTSGALHVSILLAVIAWAVLFFVVVPRQKSVVAAFDPEAIEADAAGEVHPAADPVKTAKQLNMFGGIFSALWVIVAILMFFV